MPSRTIAFLIAFLALLSIPGQAQTTPPPTPTPRADRAEPDVTHGRVKEFTAGQKLVIDVDKAIDKDYDLTDKNINFKVAKGLKVGDPVKITERRTAGDKKSIQIVKHSGGGVKHGDADRKKQ